MTRPSKKNLASSKKTLAAALGIALILGGLAAGPADARRGGSFGSRGSRTYSAPRSSYMSPSSPGPVQRSMTSPSQYPNQGGAYAPSYAPSYGSRPGGFLRGAGGGFLGGLLAGGLIGGLMGHGWGGGWGGTGGGGGLTILIQLLILGGLAWFAFNIFRRRQAPAADGWGQPQQSQGFGGFGGFGAPQPDYPPQGFSQPSPGPGPALEIPIT